MSVEPSASMDHFGWLFTLILSYPDPDTMQALNPHASGKHHWKKSKATKALRADVADLCRPHMPDEPWKRARLHYRFFKPTDRVFDEENMGARLKGAVDGVVDAGLIPDDRDKHLESFSKTTAIDRENPRIELVFQRLRADWGHRE